MSPARAAGRREGMADAVVLILARIRRMSGAQLARMQLADWASLAGVTQPEIQAAVDRFAERAHPKPKPRPKLHSVPRPRTAWDDQRPVTVTADARTVDGEHYCPHCPTHTPDRRALAVHMRKHMPKVPCEFCGRPCNPVMRGKHERRCPERPEPAAS